MMAKKWTSRTIAGATKFACVSTALFAAATSHADPIIDTTGAFTEIGAPMSLVAGAFESDVSIFIMYESTHTLLSTLLTDTGFDLAGTTFDSYLVHFDIVGRPFPGGRLVGSATFASNILGIDLFIDTMNDRDALFGAPGTTYPTGEILRGIELGGAPAGDGLFFSGGTVTVNLYTDFWVDQFRIYTAVTPPVSVPEPSTLLLLGSGLAALFASRAGRPRPRSI